ncbi:hypothetical protein JXB01_02130, partial [Candidatus Micrarchaeota archaeon]|nr:hypothetical protein [Candidatus Micrarchaeota archaeon]
YIDKFASEIEELRPQLDNIFNDPDPKFRLTGLLELRETVYERLECDTTEQWLKAYWYFSFISPYFDVKLYVVESFWKTPLIAFTMKESEADLLKKLILDSKKGGKYTFYSAYLEGDGKEILFDDICEPQFGNVDLNFLEQIANNKAKVVEGKKNIAEYLIEKLKENYNLYKIEK